MGVIAFRTDGLPPLHDAVMVANGCEDTENELAEEDSFENISVVQPLGQ